MLSAKKTTGTITPIRGLEKELQFLYARRSAIDTLIQSLETYDRAQTKIGAERTQKTA